MQRQIKFRAWDKYNKQMHHFPLFWNQAEYLDEEDVIVTQYTGLKDFKDVDIYEGDILSYKAAKRYQVVFDVAAFSAKQIRTPGTVGSIKKSTEPLAQMPASMIVIGNIFEDPEFLEVKNAN